MTMFARPRLRSSLCVEPIGREALFLLDEHRDLVFRGEEYVALAPLLDGRHSLPEIFAQLGDTVRAEQIYACLARLARQGCLSEGDVTDAALATLWDYLGVDHVARARQDPAPAVQVRTVGGIDAAPLLTALADAGLVARGFGDGNPPSPTARGPVAGDTSDGDVLLVATDDYLRAEMGEINAAALRDGTRWMPVKPVGLQLWVGPLFVPGETACWKCLEHRLHFNRQVELFVAQRTDDDGRVAAPKATAPPLQHAGAAFAALQAARELLPGAGEVAGPRTGGGLRDRLLTLDVLERELHQHRLTRRPQCVACGAREAAAAQPIRIADPAALPPHRDNGRSTTPEEAFERFRHHVSPITGVVTRLWSREADASGPTHNWAAGHYFPIPVSNDPRTLATNLFTRAGGKGASEIQAKAGALCEALERYSGIAWGAEPARHGTREQLGDQAVSPRQLLLFSDAQYRDREAFNERNRSEYHDVPPPLPDDAEIAWTPAWSLTHERFRYLPKAYCFYGHLDPGYFFVRADSNGCAAGSSLEEAILEGLLEVIERDAIALWWYNRVRRPGLDVDAFGLRYWRRIRAYHEDDLGRSLHLLDLTSDLGIPTFVAVSCRRDRVPQDITIGFGAHVDAAVAIQRAISESNQYLPALRESAADGATVYRVFDGDTVAWWRTATLDNQPYLTPSPEQPRRPDDFPLHAGRNAAEDLHTCLEQIRARGLEVLVVDQTRPDLGLPVVKVVVPGLRHFWRRLAPGRLYDIPVQLGWLDRPTAEEHMNPISCFI